MTIIDIHCTYLLYMWMYVFLSPTPYICCFFSLFMHMLLITCMQSIISVSHKDALMSFVKSVSEIQVVKVYLSQTLFLQSFSRVCVRIDFIVFNK